MVRLKQAHPHWGPRKIRDLYERRHPGAVAEREQLQAGPGTSAGLTKPQADPQGGGNRQAFERQEGRRPQ